MKREISLEEISDGRLYERNDMVKAGCGDCEGCSACCHHMGKSVILDPLDMHRLAAGLGVEAARLLEGPVELSVADGMILPNLKMDGADEGCRFLNEEGRCRIHAFRPGLCRLFPLGRYYEGERFWYFLQIHECRKKERTKVKVSRWLDIPDVPAYEAFVSCWHQFLLAVQELLRTPEGRERAKTVNLYVLNCFYLTPYEEAKEFYPQFYRRISEAELWLKGQEQGE